MTNADRKMTAESEIRQLISRWMKAAVDADIDAVMSCYAPGVVAYDAIAALQFRGVEAYRKHWDYCFTLAPGEMIFEPHDLQVTVDGDVAFAHFLIRCGGRAPDGTERAGWMRGTACYRRRNGRWQIEHEHFSVPFDVESSKALLELTP